MDKILARPDNSGNISQFIYTPFTAFGDAPLGILPNNPYPASTVGYSPSDFLVNYQTGEVYDPATDYRLKRFIRQTAAKRLLPKNRVGWCLRRVLDNETPAVLKSKSTGKCHYGGIISCGRVWECPVCAAKISQRRRDELSMALDQWRSMGGQLLLVTFTFAHNIHDDLSDLLDRQKRAHDALKKLKSYSKLRKAHGVVGSVRALEITHGSNGWHPHIHEIWFLKTDFLQVAIAGIHTTIFDLWAIQCKKNGLGVPTLRHGIDVRDGSYATAYISKWGIEDELTKANAKEGKKESRNPFQLLDSYIKKDLQAGALFAEYAAAFAGKRQVVWSKGLKKLFDLTEKTDEEIAAEQDDTVQHLGNLTIEQWAKALKFYGYHRDLRSEILTQAEYGGWDAVQSLLLRTPA